MLTVFLTCVYLFIFSMHIYEHVKDEFPLLFAGDNKVFLILILIKILLLDQFWTSIQLDIAHWAHLIDIELYECLCFYLF